MSLDSTYPFDSGREFFLSPLGGFYSREVETTGFILSSNQNNRVITRLTNQYFDYSGCTLTGLNAPCLRKFEFQSPRTRFAIMFFWISFVPP
jgi:hypothetical protein